MYFQFIYLDKYSSAGNTPVNISNMEINSPIISPVVEGSVAPAVNSAEGSASENSGSGSIFVGKLAFDCRTRELEELFGKYGRITRCDIKKGYAFIEFEDARDATDAIKYLDGSRFLGLNITVERTKNERRNASNPDGTRNSDCFKCGKSGHYARECGREGGDRGDRRNGRSEMSRRGGDRDRYAPRSDRDRYARRSRSRSPRRYERRSGRDYSPKRRDSRSPVGRRPDSRSPIRRRVSRSPVARRVSRSPVARRADSRSPVVRRNRSPASPF